MPDDSYHTLYEVLDTIHNSGTEYILSASTNVSKPVEVWVAPKLLVSGLVLQEPRPEALAGDSATPFDRVLVWLMGDRWERVCD